MRDVKLSASEQNYRRRYRDYDRSLNDMSDSNGSAADDG